MNWFFLENKFLLKILILSVIIYKFLPINFFLAWLTFWSVVLYFFRIHKIQRNIEHDNLSFLAPVNGEVKEISSNNQHPTFPGKQFKKITFLMSLTSSYGIYLPLNAKINFVNNNELIFDNKLASSVIIQTKARFSFLKPKLWVRPGDLGMVQSCIGILPAGGEVSLYISEKDDILVKVGDKVVATQTLLSTQKGIL